MVNDRNNNFDSFWFTLFHEISYMINGDFGISFENDNTIEEQKANQFAEEKLVPQNLYNNFISKGVSTTKSILSFSKKINTDPGIILGRLQNDKIIRYDDVKFKSLRKKY